MLRGSWGFQKLSRAWSRSSPGALDLGPLVSRTVRQSISSMLGHLALRVLSGQPWQAQTTRTQCLQWTKTQADTSPEETCRWKGLGVSHSGNAHQGLPGGPVVRAVPALQGASVWSLAGELRSHMPCGMAKKNNKCTLKLHWDTCRDPWGWL